MDIAKEGKPFVKNDPRINRQGRPKKTLTRINAELQAKGYEPVKPSQVQEAFEMLLALPLSEILNIAGEPKDKRNKYPALMRLAAKELLGRNGGMFLERLLDRAHGKPTQSLDMRVKPQELDLSCLDEEELEFMARINEKLRKNAT